MTTVPDDKVLLWISRIFSDQDLLIECADHEEAWNLSLKVYIHHQNLNRDYTRWSVPPLPEYDAIMSPQPVQHLAITQVIQLTMLTGFAKPPVLSHWSATQRQCLLLTKEEASRLFEDRDSLLLRKQKQEQALIAAIKAMPDTAEGPEITLFSGSGDCNIDFEALD